MHPSQQENRVDVIVAQTNSVPSELFSWERMNKDKDFELRVHDFLERRAYSNSPAKDTAECQEVKSLLEAEGVGIEAVREAYNAIWENRDFERKKAVSSAKHAMEIEPFQELFRKQAEGRLAYRFGITNQAFFDKLFRIQPKVFFGQKDLQVHEGEDISLYR